MSFLQMITDPSITLLMWVNLSFICGTLFNYVFKWCKAKDNLSAPVIYIHWEYAYISSVPEGGVFAPSSVTAISFILPQMSFTACHWIRRGEAVDKNRIAALKHQCGGAKQSLVSQANAITCSLPNLNKDRAGERDRDILTPTLKPCGAWCGPFWCCLGGLSVWRCGHVCGGVYYCLSGWLRGVLCDTDGAIPKKKCQHRVITNNTQPY